MLLGIGKRFEAAQTTPSWVDRVLTRRTAPKDSTCLSALPWTPCTQKTVTKAASENTPDQQGNKRVSLFPEDRSRQPSRRASGSRRLQPRSWANRNPYKAFQCRRPLHGCLLPREGHRGAHAAAAPSGPGSTQATLP